MKLLLLFSIIGFLCFIGLGYLHEQVHVEIHESYGLEAKVEYFSHFPNMITLVDEGCPNDSCSTAHDINDAIGYHLTPFYMLFFTGFLSIISLLEDRK